MPSKACYGHVGGGAGSSSRSNGTTTANGTDPASWEARLNAREEALKKREQVVAEAEGRIGVRRSVQTSLYHILVVII